MFVANGASSDTLNDRFSGMWSYGSGPVAAKVVKFNAVMTRQIKVQRIMN